jgi:DNA-binding NarL/FixJ family response regulator
LSDLQDDPINIDYSVDSGTHSGRGKSKIMKILIADDSEILRKHLTNLLTEIPGVDIIGYAEDTESAIAGIETENLDAAIIDIRMPGAGGIQVLKTVRQAHPDLRIIIFTDYPYPQYRKKCFEEGADYFFDKSTESEKLVELIRKMVRGEA